MSKCTLPSPYELGRQPNGWSLSKRFLGFSSERLFNAMLGFVYLYNQDVVLLKVDAAENKLSQEESYFLRKELYKAGSYYDLSDYRRNPPRLRLFRSDSVMVEPDGEVSVVVHDEPSEDFETRKANVVAAMKKTLGVLEASGVDSFKFVNEGMLVKRVVQFSCKDFADMIEAFSGKKKDGFQANNPIETGRNALMQSMFVDFRKSVEEDDRMHAIDSILDCIPGIRNDKFGSFEKTIMTDAFFEAVEHDLGEEACEKAKTFLDAARKMGCFYEPEAFIRFKLLSL